MQLLAKRSNCEPSEKHRVARRGQSRVLASFDRLSLSSAPSLSHAPSLRVSRARARPRVIERIALAHLVRSIRSSAPPNVEDFASCLAGRPLTLQSSRRNTREDPSTRSRRRPWTTPRRPSCLSRACRGCVRERSSARARRAAGNDAGPRSSRGHKKTTFFARRRGDHVARRSRRVEGDRRRE